jgi:hypothetical protein
MRGWAVFQRPFSREGREEARRLFERALATDRGTVDALGLCTSLVYGVQAAA